MTQPASPAGALAAPADVIALAGAGYDDDQIAACLQLASSVIRGYTGQAIAEVIDDVVDVTPAGYAALLPELPVTAVSAVMVKSIDPTGAVVWTTATGYDWTRNGMIYPVTVPAAWPAPGLRDSLRVTYTHGYSPVPQDIVDVCKRLAYTFILNGGFRVERKIGEKTERFASDGGSSFSPYDRAILDRFAVESVA